ncbi:MAG: peptidoglycan DD-metalloendopeptidase family protein, partial [Bacteroidia bacterium]|nr:peptidoglycan DD-metalloendopeptidase family protein [Bacteroidia bacterium]
MVFVPLSHSSKINLVSANSAVTSQTIPVVPKLFSTDLCEGFDYPFGNGNGGGNYTSPNDHKTHKGWYIATKTGEKYSLGIHTGEDWNGMGGGNSDFGQPVYATARGRVIEAKDFGAPWGNVVYIQHQVIENTKVITIYSLYAHLNELKTKKGAQVNKRDIIGTIGTGHNSFPAHLHFEIRKANMQDFEVTYWPSSNNQDVKWVMEHYYVPSEFINNHRKIRLPAKEDTCLLVEKSRYKLSVYTKGHLYKEFDIALSQNPVGHKQVEGDNRMPEGAYYITEKNRGPFYG